jgi:glycosyltransferase involved in cell wall biosynthesis
VKKKILFYTPFNRRARDVESVIFAFKAHGYDVVSLSQEDGGEFNRNLAAHGVRALAYSVPGRKSALYFFKHLLYLIRFCKRENVSVVFSHLEPASFVASIAQYFVNAKVFLCRHHINEAALYHFDKSLAYWLTYFLARRIIVVSQAAIRYMLDVENIAQKKLLHINLGYDFSLYAKPDPLKAATIRGKSQGRLNLITACRLTRFKRPGFSLQVLKKLRNKGVDASLILLGEGELRAELEQFVSQNGLNEWVTMPGHVNNMMDYLSAADWVVHPSVLESSCVLIKEAGLVERPVIVCKGIGDFDDYIQNEENGFLVSPDTFVDEGVELILNNRMDHDKLNLIGSNLKQTICSRFDIENVFPQYLSLLTK